MRLELWEGFGVQARLVGGGNFEYGLIDDSACMVIWLRFEWRSDGIGMKRGFQVLNGVLQFPNRAGFDLVFSVVEIGFFCFLPR